MLKKEILELMKEVREHLKFTYGHQRVLEIQSEDLKRLTEENRRLVAMNERLMDRLMSRDFEQFAVFAPPSQEDKPPFDTTAQVSIDENEDNIGEVVEDDGSDK